MPRPKQTVTRDHQLNLSLTLAEVEILTVRADAVGLRLAAYARAVLLHEFVLIENRSTLSRNDRLLLQQWQRVGANLNQVARVLNRQGHIEAGAVAAVLDALRALLQETRR